MEFTSQLMGGREAFAEDHDFVTLPGHVLEEIGGLLEFGRFVASGDELSQRAEVFGKRGARAGSFGDLSTDGGVGGAECFAMGGSMSPGVLVL
jgi:hypothetical protein